MLCIVPPIPLTSSQPANKSTFKQTKWVGGDYQRRPGANSSTRQARRIVPYAVGAYLGIHMDASDLADVSFHDACFSKKKTYIEMSQEIQKLFLISYREVHGPLTSKTFRLQ